MNFGVRDARGADLAALRDVYRRSSLSNENDREELLGHPEVPEYSVPTLSNGRCRVAVADSQVLIGFATTVQWSDLLELVDLFVDPQWMRRGVGRTLIDDVVTFATATRIPRVEVDGNPHALRFYEACGFEVDTNVQTEFGVGYRMRRRPRVKLAN